MVIDFHNHLGTSPDSGVGSLDSILENMALCGIARSVLFAIDEADSGLNFEDVNSRVIQAQQKYPDKIIAFARIVPETGAAARGELQRCLALGVKGLKLKIAADSGLRLVRPVLDLLYEHNGFPVVVHTAHAKGSTPEEWEMIIKDYPGLNFVLAHGGKDHYRQCARIAAEYPNVFVDTSALSLHRTRIILKIAGSRKLVFASDYPYSHPALELKKYELLVSDAREIEDILFKNALRLLGAHFS